MFERECCLEKELKCSVFEVEIMDQIDLQLLFRVEIECMTKWTYSVVKAKMSEGI